MRSRVSSISAAPSSTSGISSTASWRRVSSSGLPTSTSFPRTTFRRRTEMICEKDVENGKAFWEEAERKTYKVSGWYLLDTDDEYWYKLGSDTIVIEEKSEPEQYPFLKVIYRSKFGAVSMLDSLEDQLKDFDDEGLTALQYELDMFREDFDDFLTPEQVEWFNQLYDIVSSELDARWLLKKLEERRIVKIERDA
nr:MAG TPA: hypothetical protein [Caudoviricetes sp.]